MQLTFEDTFKVSDYGGDKSAQLFVVQDLALNHVIEVDLDTKTPEGKAIDEMMKVEWQASMKKLKGDKEKQFKDVFLSTQESLLKSAEKQKKAFQDGATKDGKLDQKALSAAVGTWLTEEVKGANVMIKNALTALNGTFAGIMEETWKKSAAAIDAKFKTAIKGKKIKASTRIVGEISVIFAESVGPLIVQGIALGMDIKAKRLPPTEILQSVMGLAKETFQTTMTGVTKSVQAVQKNAPSHAKAATKVQTAMTNLATSLKQAKGDEKGGKGGGLKDKIKKAFATNPNQKKELEGALKELETWNLSLMQDIEALAKTSTDSQKQGRAQYSEGIGKLAFAALTEQDKKGFKGLETAISGIFKKMDDEDQKIAKAREVLKAYGKIVGDAREILKTEDETASDKLGELVGKVNAIITSPEVGYLKALGTATLNLSKEIVTTIKAHK